MEGTKSGKPEYDTSSVARLNGWVDIPIPSNQMLLQQWYAWTFKTVKRHFLRDKERIHDTVQNVRQRWLMKDGIGRWFYKHLTDDLLNRTQAELILGGVKIAFVGELTPVHGNRMEESSLWRISDLLAFASFDYERYYYSIQGHTIDSTKMLRLLGYPKDKFSVLQSLYRQGKIQPSELTEHDCIRRGKIGIRPKACSGCIHGLSILRQRGLSLAHDWSSDSVRPLVEKLRWNDSQLRPFLRNWRKSNIVKCVPKYIMRTSLKPGVTAGLLKYAETVFNNEVINDFKRMTKTDDMTLSVFNNGMSPEISDEESVGFEIDEETETVQKVIKDSSGNARLHEFEAFNDLRILLKNAALTDEEFRVIEAVDLNEVSVKQYANRSGLTIPRIHRVRSIALRKLRSVAL